MGPRGASAHAARGHGAGHRGRGAHSTAHDQLGQLGTLSRRGAGVAGRHELRERLLRRHPRHRRGARRTVSLDGVEARRGHARFATPPSPSFFLAGAAGLLLASRTSWWLVAIGATAIAAGWFYTGGPRPYGYYGFGELFVFIYFGIVATVGTAYVQHLTIPSRSWWLGVATGFMACALLEANNLRDVDGRPVVGQEDAGRAPQSRRARRGSSRSACVGRARRHRRVGPRRHRHRRDPPLRPGDSPGVLDEERSRAACRC